MKEPTIVFRNGPNLAVYRQIEELQHYWEMRWKNTNLKRVLKNARSGNLGELESPFIENLPKDSPILEAGCGPGRIVCALQARGYTVEGIDYAADTIERVRQFAPELNLRAGDILAVDRPDGYYGAYISLGVLEHAEDGPDAGLVEAWRILKPGGAALVMVPYLNQPRRKAYKAAAPLNPDLVPKRMRFYQYQFDPADFENRLASAGFDVTSSLPLQLLEGFSSDFRLGRWLYTRHYFSWRLYRKLQRMGEHFPEAIRQNFSHMRLFIARKPNRNL